MKKSAPLTGSKQNRVITLDTLNIDWILDHENYKHQNIIQVSLSLDDNRKLTELPFQAVPTRI
jgi:hypothetical protein